ncbi:Uncharacterized protein TCM_018992 [Theobroma cacao]|uniref:Uncharacterized protein n=1 Tax=Theobroma cacao TaxID=3641 RepID=A0A061EGN7_THECC|nr:Uncharacterized protein TCM_018992 [Theobroma cacao]
MRNKLMYQTKYAVQIINIKEIVDYLKPWITYYFLMARLSDSPVESPAVVTCRSGNPTARRGCENSLKIKLGVATNLFLLGAIGHLLTRF